MERIPIGVLIFDLDGTLVDSSTDIVSAMNHALRVMHLPERRPEEIISYIGTGVSDLVRKSLGRRHVALVAKGVALFSSYYVKHPADTSTLYPHVVQTLAYFAKKRKIVLTNRYRRFAEATLKALGIRAYFEEIVGGDDERCKKPSPCLLKKMMADLAIAPADALVIGDMAIDVVAAKNAGMKSCWVTYGLGKRSEVRPLKPDYIIDDMRALRKIIR